MLLVNVVFAVVVGFIMYGFILLCTIAVGWIGIHMLWLHWKLKYPILPYWIAVKVIYEAFLGFYVERMHDALLGAGVAVTIFTFVILSFT